MNFNEVVVWVQSSISNEIWAMNQNEMWFILELFLDRKEICKYLALQQAKEPTWFWRSPGSRRTSARGFQQILRWRCWCRIWGPGERPWRSWTSSWSGPWRQSSEPVWGSTGGRWRGFLKTKIIENNTVTNNMKTDLSRRGTLPRSSAPWQCSPPHLCRACPDVPKND